MPNVNVAPNQQGAPEVSLAANEASSVTFAPSPYRTARVIVQVIHQDGDKPLYVSGKQLPVKHAEATPVLPGSWLDYDAGTAFEDGKPLTIWLISEAAAVVSVVRS